MKKIMGFLKKMFKFLRKNIKIDFVFIDGQINIVMVYNVFFFKKTFYYPLPFDAYNNLIDHVLGLVHIPQKNFDIDLLKNGDLKFKIEIGRASCRERV